MTKKEIKEWIDRWSKLKPCQTRDKVIEIWAKVYNNIA